MMLSNNELGKWYELRAQETSEYCKAIDLLNLTYLNRIEAILLEENIIKPKSKLIYESMNMSMYRSQLIDLLIDSNNISDTDISEISNISNNNNNVKLNLPRLDIDIINDPLISITDYHEFELDQMMK